MTVATVNIIHKTLISGQEVDSIDFRFSVPAPTKIISILSSSYFIELITEDVKVPLSDCIPILTNVDTNKEIKIKSFKDSSLELSSTSMLLPKKVYKLSFKSNKNMKIVTIPMSELLVRIVSEDSENLASYKVKIQAGELVQISIKSLPVALQRHSVTSIVKYCDMYGNITKPSDNLDKPKQILVKIIDLQGNLVSSCVQWKLNEPRNGFSALLGLQINQTGHYKIYLEKDRNTIAVSNVISIFESKTVHSDKCIHWNTVYDIRDKFFIQKITGNMLAINTNESITPIGHINSGIYEINSCLSQIPINNTFDVIIISSEDNGKNILYREHGTSLQKAYSKLSESTLYNYDNRKCIKKYTSLAKLYDYRSPLIKKDADAKFMDIFLKYGDTVEDVISKIKKGNSGKTKNVPSLYCAHIEKISIHSDKHPKNAIIASYSSIRNEIHTLKNFTKGRTYISTGINTTLFIEMFKHYPKFESIKIDSKSGFKYTRHFNILVACAEEIKYLYLIKNNEILYKYSDTNKFIVDISYDDTSLITGFTSYYAIVEHENGHLVVSSPISIVIG